MTSRPSPELRYSTAASLGLTWTTAVAVSLARLAGIPAATAGVPLAISLAAAVVCAVRGAAGAAVFIIILGSLATAGLARGAASVRSVPAGGPVVLLGTAEETVSGGLVVDVEAQVGRESGAEVPSTILVPLIGSNAVVPGAKIEVEASGLRPPGSRPGPRSLEAVDRLGVGNIAEGARITPLAPPPWWRQAVSAVRSTVIHAVHTAVPEPAGALLLGVAFGWHEPIDALTRASMQDAGLIHIVAVSGLKVVIVAALLQALLVHLPLSRRVRGVAILVGVGIFVVLSGAGPAAVRSGLTAAAAFALSGDSRRPRPFAILGLCATIMLLISPRLVGDVGFQLSVLGTGGILLLARPIATRLPGPALMVEPFAVTLAAQAATVPIMASVFGSISLVGPLANAVVLPMLPLIILAAWIAVPCVVLIPPAAAVLLSAAGAACSGIVVIARLFAALPLSALHLGRWPPQWTLGELAGLAALVATVSITRIRGRGPDA